MQGYDAASYGDGFADVYDEWYPDDDQTALAAAVVAELAAGGPVLELGVGTGRIALPIARTGLVVTGVDASAAMLERLAAKPDGGLVRAHLGDMGAALPGGPYRVVFVANNTLFNLDSAEAQQRAFAAVHDVLDVGGCFVVEAFVPEVPHGSTSGVEVRNLARDRVVLSVHRTDPDRQRAEGSYVEFTEAGGVRLRPWSIRYSTPAELDRLAGTANLELSERYAGWDRSPFDERAAHHVSIYRRVV